ncbi:DUF3486 family protein [Agarivorans gilvus]|uniref:Mu-like prophage FluMu protein gp27 n=1 Tax=Agarivorans gilvus TaxID=680279 RepID=A0ABQ1HX35_9ALTE|nr:DUF3486 family protein [Agarivorans gilvus]GGA95851.1 Mu-like prophage FluMu protein gp27 [Agarivorans gilvus]
MAERKTRGKPSKVDSLPDHIKDYLHELLRSGSTQAEILTLVNTAIDQAGLPDDDKLSRSGLNRYASRMETIGGEIREMREMTEVWVAKLGSKPTGEATQLLLEILKSAHFKLLMKTAEDPDEVLDPKTLSNLALSIGRLEKAAMLSTQREKELRKAFAEEAASAAENAATEAGLTKAGVAQIKQQILGIV